jgi:hypothetical protein
MSHGGIERRAGEPWKCPHCRAKLNYGSTVVQRTDMKWYGCAPCATLTSCGRPAILLPSAGAPDLAIDLNWNEWPTSTPET